MAIFVEFLCRISPMISCGRVETSPSSWPSLWTCCCPPQPRPRPVDWTCKMKSVLISAAASLTPGCVWGKPSGCFSDPPSRKDWWNLLCQHLRTAGQPEYSNVCVYNHSKENLNYLLPRLEMTSQSPRPHLAGHQKHRLRGLHQAFHGLELVNARHCNKFTEER